MGASKGLIVGAGPVGLVLAAELHRHGVRARIVERRPSIQPYSRAIAIQPRTLEALAPSGVTARLLRRGIPARRFHVVVGHHALDATFDDLDTPYPQVLMLPQGDTERELTQHLADHGIEVECPVELVSLDFDGDGVDVLLRKGHGTPVEERFDWVVGCDGSQSVVRQAIGADWVGEDLALHFAIADVDLDWDRPRDETWLYVSEVGLCALFPLPSGPRAWRIIADFPQHGAPEITLDVVRELVRARAGLDLEPTNPAALVSWSTRERLSSAFRNGRVFLAGDAAHVHSPLGGQGMNTGLQDAHNLAWKLGLVAHGAPWSLMDSYEPERKRVAEQVLRDTHNATRAATARGAITQGFRDRIFGFLMGFDLIQRSVLGRTSEVDVSYRASPIVGSRGRGSTLLHPGDHVPDVPLNAAVDLYRLLATRAHVVLLFDGGEIDRHAAMIEVAAELARTRPGLVQPYLVLRAGVRPDGVPRDAPSVLDGHGALHDRLGALAGSALVVRPDGYLGWTGRPATLQALEEHLVTVLGPPGA
jgi:2-polyprenyl-6-methoxyphenol hydroxylase-like FAD-dependent oxidoreductase